MTIQCIDAHRQPLDDTVSVRVFRGTSGYVEREQSDVSGLVPVAFDSLTEPTALYRVQVWPTHYRPVSQFVFGDAEARVFCPIRPDKVRVLHIDPAVARSLPVEARRLTMMTERELACLLNIWAVLGVVTVGHQQSLRSFVTRVDRITSERIYIDTLPALPALLAQSPIFTAVSDVLHEPPDGYVRAGSYKRTVFDSGVLQITLFRQGETWMADLDIDDANGIGHVVQVLDHWLTNDHTDPYDIHQILTFHQRVDPGYRLLLA